MEYSMKSIEELSQSRLPIVKINKTLNKYDNMPLFQDKVDRANDTLKRVGMPVLPMVTQDNALAKIMQTIQSLREINSIMVFQQKTLEVKQIESYQEIRTKLLKELTQLLQDMDIELPVAC
jgi:predicted regulator of amino acid metabolism with ACT domain